MNKELLKHIPKDSQDLWTSTYNVAINSHSSQRSEKIAWSNVQSNLNNNTDKITFNFIADTASISKSSDGYSYVDYALSSNSLDAQGTKFGNFALTNMVDQINSEGLVGALDDNVHEEWNRLKAQGYSPAEIEAILQSRETGIRAISAFIDKNKVVARLKVKSSLMSEVMKYKGASVEARVPLDAVSGNTFKQARLQGFILTNHPSNPDAYRIE